MELLLQRIPEGSAPVEFAAAAQLEDTSSRVGLTSRSDPFKSSSSHLYHPHIRVRWTNKQHEHRRFPTPRNSGVILHNFEKQFSSALTSCFVLTIKPRLAVGRQFSLFNNTTQIETSETSRQALQFLRSPKGNSPRSSRDRRTIHRRMMGRGALTPRLSREESRPATDHRGTC